MLVTTTVVVTLCADRQPVHGRGRLVRRRRRRPRERGRRTRRQRTLEHRASQDLHGSAPRAARDPRRVRKRSRGASCPGRHTFPPASSRSPAGAPGDTSIEQRRPPDAGVPEKFGTFAPPTDRDRLGRRTDREDRRAQRKWRVRTMLFSFPGQPAGCAQLQITVSGHDTAVVDGIADGLLRAPFRSSQPLVTTTGTATSVPTVAVCDGVHAWRAGCGRDDWRSGGRAGGVRPPDRHADRLPRRSSAALPARILQELHLADSSMAFVAEPRGPGVVVTTVHVLSTPSGWTGDDWEASGC